MQYVTWFARMYFGVWMVTNGLMHFLHLWPQPMGSQPLSMELTAALIDSRLFIGVKAVEVLAGFALMLGLWVPFWLVVCLPVSFVVAYYGEFLEGSRSHAGLIVFISHVFLCFAYIKSYRPMFTLKAQPRMPAFNVATAHPGATPAE